MHLTKRLSPSTNLEPTSRAKTSKRNNVVITEDLCRMLPVMATALAGGASISSAIAEASEAANGELAKELREVREALEQGEALNQTLNRLAAKLKHRGVSELVAKLTLAASLGTPVVSQLYELARSEELSLDEYRMRLAAKAETRMLIPLVFLILPISVLFALYPSLSILQSTNYR